jgi:3-hydroxy-9,10-secoandrosta-1,3,5(10)-triene-9,17-dione monooxygenase
MSFDVPDPGLTPDQMVARAVALRSHLVDEQEKTEMRSRFSEETQKLFTDAGFYRILQPRMFGGYEFDISTFFRTIIEIARGCPSSGWLLCLGAATRCNSGRRSRSRRRRRCSAPTVTSSPAQRRQLARCAAKPVDGGYLVSGKWRYASGVPYSTDFMGLAEIEGADPPEPIIVIVLASTTRSSRTGAS